MKRLLLVGCFVFSGCSTEQHPLERSPMDFLLHGYGPAVKEFPGPDGRKGFSISCDTGARSSECYEAAAKVCGGQYEVIARGAVDGDGVLDVICKTSPQS